MNDIILTFSLAAAGVFAVAALGRYLAQRTRGEMDYIRFAEKFFDAAAVVGARPDAPPSLLHMLPVMSRMLQLRTMPVLICVFFSLLKVSGRHSSAEPEALKKSTQAGGPEIEVAYREMMTAWFMAATARSPILGYIARRMLRSGIKQVAVVESVERHYHGHGGDMAAA